MSNRVRWDDLDKDQRSKINWIIVHLRNWWIREQSGFLAPLSEWSSITVRDPDHPKGICTQSPNPLHYESRFNPHSKVRRTILVKVWRGGDGVRGGTNGHHKLSPTCNALNFLKLSLLLLWTIFHRLTEKQQERDITKCKFWEKRILGKIPSPRWDLNPLPIWD